MESWNAFLLLLVATSLSPRRWCYVVPASYGSIIPHHNHTGGYQEIVCCEADARGSGRGTWSTSSPRPPVVTGRPPHPDSEWLGRQPPSSSSLATMQTLSERKSDIACRTYASRTPKTVVQYIAGGTVAKKGDFPHMALLGYHSTEDGMNVSWNCGGSLISDRYVMTAAHCIAKSLRKPNVVRLGELDVTTEADGAIHVDYAIEQVDLHPSYDGKSNYHDIALISLKQSVSFTEFISPACLYSGGGGAVARNGGSTAGDFNDLTERKLSDGEEIGQSLNDEVDLRGKSLIASGWGKTEYNGDRSPVLLKAELLPYASDICRKNLSLASGRSSNDRMPRGLMPNIMMCAGDPVGNKDTCLGDSGGPIQFQTEDFPLYTVVGITSFGEKCGFSLPAVYTRVSYYLDWIEGIVWRGPPPY